MTWTASLMPDDALPPDSLVRRMLNPEPECHDVPPVFPEDGSSLPVLTEDVLTASERTELPLWREMLKAGMHAERCDPGTVRHSVAAEIEALRDWLLPEEPPLTEEENACLVTWGKWRQRGRLRALLTEQARIARGEG